MLGVVENPLRTPSDDVMEKVATEMGVADTFHPTPVGVFFGDAGAGHGPDGRRPVLRRRRPRAQDLHRLRLLHDRLPPQRQEHPGQELPPPRRGQRREGAAAHHGHPGRAARRRRVRRPRRATPRPRSTAALAAPGAHRRAGRVRGVRARHPAAAAPDEGRGPPAAGLRPARLPVAHQLRVDRRRDRAPRHDRRLQPGHRDHVELPPRRRTPTSSRSATARAAT